ncbi:histone-lysine N-methyltransferase 2D, partial [Nematolebias whitei]|uniref:histone-lysine N-methyltransferase 2D n=1 Tax=Nematolebias whitei TaxID=451745 RepID=UPI00189C2094
MPSEAQEPRDRGPPPPVTRAGRSAHLAKAKASSPALERRPRGRPRKDGSNGRSAPPTPSLPPPPPLPKSRKKGRSRGRAQVVDEESTDTAEKSRPQRTEPRGSSGISTEPKEPKAQREVKAAGRRRSASRRKSHANPDPENYQYRLSPHSELDPDLAVPSHGPEPLPCFEEKNRTSPDPAALPTDPVFEVHTLSPAPDLRPDPDPSEEDQPSTIHNPAPTEAEGGEASPMGLCPVTSPLSSAPVSPCVRLEDEDSLSPLFQRSLSEDSGGSPTPSLDLSKKRLKQCAFCYRGDQPPLGQGRLLVFGPTPGYIPLHILNRHTSSDRDDDCPEHCYRGNRDPPTSSSLELRVSSLCGASAEDQSSSEFIKQVGPIGLPHDVNVQSLFDATGQCCAHLHCASWSEGVHRGEGQSLLYVDRAIDSGSTQVCAFCQRLGASLRCQETSCGQSYHFPCAAAAGAQQDWSQRLTLCTRHAHTDSLRCVACSDGAGPGSLLMCCCCGNCYHGSCLVPPLSPSPLLRAGWQCPECQVCRSCRVREDDTELLVCERCDKAYHTHCLTPPVDHGPSSSWTCRNCRVCRRCGVMSSGQWANHLFLCESCDPAPPCLLCGHTPDFSTPQEVLTCTCCHRLVHAECLVQSGEGRTGSEGYTCSSCRPQGTEQTLSISHTSAPPTNISLSQVPPHTETPPISAPAHSPVQLISSEPSQTETSELQHSPKPSPEKHQRSPQAEEKQDSPSIEDLPIRLRKPTTVLKVPSARSLKGLEGPAPSSLELQRSLSSSKENNQCCSPSPDDTRTNPSLVPTKHKHSPVWTSETICQSPAPSTEEQRQSPAPSTEKQQQSPTPSTEEQRQSPAP